MALRMKLAKLLLISNFTIALVFVFGCEQSQSVAMTPDEVRVEGIRFIQKKPDFGGEACIAMYLQSLGSSIDQDYVFDQSGIDPLEGRGCTTRELVVAAKQLGIDPGDVWFSINPEARNRQLATEIEKLETDIVAQTPWTVCLQMDDGQRFMLIVGIDTVKKEIVFHNPNRENGNHNRMSFEEFVTRWILKDENGFEYVVKLRMTEPARLTGTASETFTDADYAQHIRDLKTRLPEGDFKIVIQKPFVVIGDEDLETVKRRSRNTVGWSVSRLKKTYFTKDPIHILDIWLFKDKDSYNTNAKKLFGRKPGTPFGYYSSYNKALVMNISTGGGTLVHEIVHPFIESNFPECPSWFNEGFASLYEQCRDNDGLIWGSTNWRLRGLQLAILDGRVPSFEELTSTTRTEFYDEDPGTNYAQARYLCYYLQEQGKLVKYYETFRDNVENDPTGVESLKAILETDDLAKFKRSWQKYVQALRF